MDQITISDGASGGQLDEVQQLRGEVKELQSGKTAIELEVRNLKERFNDLNEQLRDTERYLSKDCVKLKYPPFDALKHAGFLSDSLAIFRDYRGVQHIVESRQKAYHIMPGFDSLPYGLMPSVIVKFVMFDDKHQDFASRWKLNKQMNPLNGKKMYIIERLPTMEAKLRQSLSDMGYITSSNKCVVSVKCLKDNRNNTYVPVKNVNEVQALKNPMKQNNSTGIAKKKD